MYGIRTLKRSDLAACARLYVTAFNAPPWNDHWTVPAARRRLEDILDTPRFYGLVQYEGKVLLGAILGNIERWYDRSHYNLKEMYIHPGRQRSGIGSALLTRARRDLAAKRVIGVYLFTSADSWVAGFYKKNGYRPVKGMQMMNRTITHRV